MKCLAVLAGMIAIAVPASAEPGTRAPRPSVALKYNTSHEQATKQQLFELIAKYDTSRWTFTDQVMIDQTSIPHSHPVLTLHTRNYAHPMRLLATYLHENIHWWLDSRMPTTDAAIEELRQTYPSAPVGFPQGGADENSTYLHLLTCWLENEAMKDVAGEQAAEEVLTAMTKARYTWVYERVRDDNAAIARIVAKYGLDPRVAAGPGRSTRMTP